MSPTGSKVGVVVGPFWPRAVELAADLRQLLEARELRELRREAGAVHRVQRILVLQLRHQQRQELGLADLAVARPLLLPELLPSRAAAGCRARRRRAAPESLSASADTAEMPIEAAVVATTGGIIFRPSRSPDRAPWRIVEHGSRSRCAQVRSGRMPRDRSRRAIATAVAARLRADVDEEALQADVVPLEKQAASCGCWLASRVRVLVLGEHRRAYAVASEAEADSMRPFHRLEIEMQRVAAARGGESVRAREGSTQLGSPASPLAKPDTRSRVVPFRTRAAAVVVARRAERVRAQSRHRRRAAQSPLTVLQRPSTAARGQLAWPRCPCWPDACVPSGRVAASSPSPLAMRAARGAAVCGNGGAVRRFRLVVPCWAVPVRDPSAVAARPWYQDAVTRRLLRGLVTASAAADARRAPRDACAPRRPALFAGWLFATVTAPARRARWRRRRPSPASPRSVRCPLP